MQISLDYYGVLFEYPFQYFLRTNEDFTTKDEYYNFLPEFENTIDDSMILNIYFRLIERYTMLKKFGYNPMPKVDVSLTDRVLIDSLSSISENSFLSQFAVASHLSIGTKANVTEIIDENEEQVSKIITNPFLRSALQNEYNRIKNINQIQKNILMQ